MTNSIFLVEYNNLQEIGSKGKRMLKKPTAKKAKPTKKRHIEIEYEMESEKPRQKARH